MNATKKKFDLMYIAGMLSDCQELVGPELNDEDGWVAPDNAQMVIAVLNNAKELMFKQMRTETDRFQKEIA
jgi:hypothetical protein